MGRSEGDWHQVRTGCQGSIHASSTVFCTVFSIYTERDSQMPGPQGSTARRFQTRWEKLKQQQTTLNSKTTQLEIWLRALCTLPHPDTTTCTLFVSTGCSHTDPQVANFPAAKPIMKPWRAESPSHVEHRLNQKVLDSIRRSVPRLTTTGLPWE